MQDEGAKGGGREGKTTFSIAAHQANFCENTKNAMKTNEHAIETNENKWKCNDNAMNTYENAMKFDLQKPPAKYQKSRSKTMVKSLHGDPHNGEISSYLFLVVLEILGS